MVGVIAAPTAGVETAIVFVAKFIPNWLLPTAGTVALANAGIVVAPDVIVVPFTVITYPESEFVLAAICDEAVAAAVGENNWLKVIAPLVAVEQSGMPEVELIVAPVQKMRDSGIVPVRVIWFAVAAATVPVSVEPVLALVDVKVVIRT